MLKIDIRQLSFTIGGKIHCDEEERSRVVEGLTWDTRKLLPGNIFLALPGESVDGNDYVAQAINAGAGAVICTREPDEGTIALADEFICPLLWVDDGVEALGKIAHYWRRELHAIVIGVTGSTGKTSTKDLLASVLSQRFKVEATVGNHNNELGLPLTILEADEDCEVLIVEMGMRGLGQIEKLCKVAEPTIGVVSNVGVCHMELLGTRENIAKAKSELLAALPSAGVAFVNADDDMTPLLLQEGQCVEHGVEVRSFGFDDNADVRGFDVKLDEDAHASFSVSSESKVFDVTCSMPGEHNVMNALSAIAVAHYLGVPDEDIAAGVALAQGSGMRLELVKMANGARIINDAYNANPQSMRASLMTLKAMRCTGKRYAVLGDMGELGSKEHEMHEEVGHLAAAAGIDNLICVGDLARNIAIGAQGASMAPAVIMTFDDIEAAVDYLKTAVQPDDAVLVKASRFMGLERIVKELVSDD